MATYLIGTLQTITRQAGDDFDIVFTVPNEFSPTISTAKFCVYQPDGTKIYEKAASPGIVVAGKTITVTFAAADTKNTAFKGKWELEVVDSTTKRYTIGRGEFALLKEYITNPTS